MRECNNFEITASKLLKVVHRSTERIKIHVVSDAAMIADKQHEFYITENLSGSREERDRVLKYYGDTPVWNIHIEFDCKLASPTGRSVVAAIVANCYYSDIREGFMQEKADRRKAKRREYYRRRKEEDGNA